MFYINEISFFSQLQNQALWIFFSTLTLRPFMKYHSVPRFLSRNITKVDPPTHYVWLNYWTNPLLSKILVTIPLCNLIPCLFQLNFVFFTGIYFSLVLFQAFHFLRTARVFSCEMCEIFKNTFSSRTLPVAAPVYTSLFTLTCLCLFTLYLSILKFSLYYYMNLIKLVKYGEYRNYDDIF